MQRAGTEVGRDGQDRGERDGGDSVASVGAQRVRDHLARRRAAGLVEVKAWVRAADVDRAHAALRSLTDEAGRDLARRARQGRTNQAAPARLPGKGAAEGMGPSLGWGARMLARRGRERGAATDELRRAVAPHGGVVRAS